MDKPTEKKTVRFDYLKSSAFRTIHADGVYGGLTPNGNIFAAFFNQRQPIPDAMVHEVSPDGQIGEELADERIGRKAIIREVEVGVVLDLAMAKSLRDWLTEKIDKLSELQEKEKAAKQESNVERPTQLKQ